MNLESAVKKVEKAGAMLVFPIANQKNPASLWYAFFPRSKMRWEWDDSGDNRVGELWHLRAELSDCREVVYTKWFRGRATLFSREVFTAMLCALGSTSANPKPLTRYASLILDELRENSPQSPRELRKSLQLQGKPYEATFQRALKELWSRLLIVGFGEIDDGAFPSLAIGWSGSLFEDLWEDAAKMSYAESIEVLRQYFDEDNHFFHYFLRLRNKSTAKEARPAKRAIGSSERRLPQL